MDTKKMGPHVDPHEIIGNEDCQAQLRAIHPEWSDEMIRAIASERGPIIRDKMPTWPHQSGKPWIRGITEDGRTCWV